MQYQRGYWLRIGAYLVIGFGLLFSSSGCTLFQIILSNSPTLEPQKIEEIDKQPDEIVISLTEEIIEAEPYQPELGDTMRWIDSSLLVYIPPDEFTMGHDGEDNPEHTVYLDGFWIYRTEVTNRMYLNCMAKGKCTQPAVDPAIPDLTIPSLADNPVVGITWFQAVEYCKFIDGTLPTESQWEKTARGREGYLYPWGDITPVCDLLNFDDCVGELSPVKDYVLGVSPYDVFDMAGNVFEWVNDWYREDYYLETPFSNPMGPEVGEARSVRGSTYQSKPDQIESSLRYFLEPDEYRSDLGFRCVVGRAENYAPPCQILAEVDFDDLGENPDDAPGGSASCIVQEPQVSVVTYCQDGHRGNNISWSPADADVTYSSENTWCSMYDADTLACGGDYGGMIYFEACKSCPPPVVELGILAVCEDPYILDDVDQLCRYDGPSVPERTVCAPGYSLSGDSSCCQQVDGTPLDFPVCPVGGEFDPLSSVCWYKLPSTGDEKCVSESVFFKWCPPDPGDKEPTDPCSNLSINQCEIDIGCVWDFDAEVCRSE